ncbi:MAG TPA: cobalt-precorrin-6A reductase [Polyangiales bacterium]|nr:cobalt-precorrin-6A reductase [Polyangiales bacterium]
MRLRVLVLGGTAEGRVLAERLAGDVRFDALLSFAGRTASLKRPDLPHRIGGFGGLDGLAEFLIRERFAALVDATHPFADQMSSNACAAAQRVCVPLIRLERAAWRALPGDRWIEVANMAAAVSAIGETSRRVFLSVGRTEVDAFRVAPQHEYLIRAVDTFMPELPRARVLAARGPFALADETELLTRERIEVVVSKNSGTDATYAKLEAARALALPVIMVARPQLPAAPLAHTLSEIEVWLEALHRSAPDQRRDE